MWYSSCLILSFSIEVLASFVPEAEVGMVAGIRGSCPDGSRLVSSDDVGHPLLMGVSLDLYDVPVPAIVSMLLGGFFYIFLRNQMIQKEMKLNACSWRR